MKKFTLKRETFLKERGLACPVCHWVNNTLSGMSLIPNENFSVCDNCGAIFHTATAAAKDMEERVF